jgi:hypothetical protein
MSTLIGTVMIKPASVAEKGRCLNILNHAFSEKNLL